MADTVVTTKELQIKCTLQDGEGAQVTRTISVEDPNAKATNINKLRALEAALITDRNKFVQPGSWRDENEDEGAYTTTGVEFIEVETTKTTYDVGNLWVGVYGTYYGGEFFEQGFAIFDPESQVATVEVESNSNRDIGGITDINMTATRNGDFILVRFSYTGTVTEGEQSNTLEITCKNSENTEIATADARIENIKANGVASFSFTATVTA